MPSRANLSRAGRPGIKAKGKNNMRSPETKLLLQLLGTSFLVVFSSNLQIIPIWVTTSLLVISATLWWLSKLPGKNVNVNPIRADQFLPESVPPGEFDTIVIGSGIGGSTCANLLAQSGQRVLLLEQHYRTGGCTHSFKKNGCEWDTGLHYTSKDMGTKTTRPGALVHFMTGGLQEWSDLDDPYDEVNFPNDENVKPGLPNTSSYRFRTEPNPCGKNATMDDIIASIDPANEELKKRVHVYVALCLEISDGFTALGISRVLPSWLHFLVNKRVERLYRIASMTVRDVQYAIFNLGYGPDQLLLASSCPKAPIGPEPDPCLRRLKAVLTHPIGDYAVQPREASMAAHGVTMAHYSRGASYTVGPTKNLSIRASSLVREFGGDVFTNAFVYEIIVENGRAAGVRVGETKAAAPESAATAAAGLPEVEASVMLTEIRAKNIVWSGGIYNLYSKRLPQDLPQVKDFQDSAKRTVRPSNGHIFLFCKLRGDASDLDLPTHNKWWFNNYDLDEAYDEYFSNPRSTCPPTVYIGFPCTKDVTWKKRFPGVSNCVLISDGLWEWFKEWEDKPAANRGESYEVFKKQLSENLLDILYEMVPQTKGKVEFHMLGTPLTEVTYFASFQGGSYGTKCVPEMFDEVNRKWTTSPRTSIPGLFLAGSDAFLPSVCGAMYGGCFGAVAVLGYARSLRLLWAYLSDFASSLKKENPELTWVRAFYLAAKMAAWK
jgi:all-trans-retinol 13,14-reductase